MKFYTRFKREIEDAIKNNDAELFEQVLSYCFDLGYRERVCAIFSAEHDARVRGLEYKVEEQKKTPGILTAEVLTLGDIITLRSDPRGKIEADKRAEVTVVDGRYLYLGEIGSKLFDKVITCVFDTIEIKRLPNGEYITFGQYRHF